MCSLEPEILKTLDMMHTHGFRVLMFYVWMPTVTLIIATIILKLTYKEKYISY
ncbi:MAG: hypothetical protein ACRCX2_10830 [Paraclostridium sp.]